MHWGKLRVLKNAKIAQLLAVMEIARRAGAEGAIERQRIAARRMQKNILGNGCVHCRKSISRVVFESSNAILQDTLIAQGDTASVSVSLRRIVIRALQINASALIAAHNHPSGAIKPSESDRLLTKDLIAATRPLGIKVLDHLIIGDSDEYSFADEELLDELEKECSAPGTV